MQKKLGLPGEKPTVVGSWRRGAPSRGRLHQPWSAAALEVAGGFSPWDCERARAGQESAAFSGALDGLLVSVEIQKVHRQPASAKWYDRRDYVFIEFCVEDSKDVNVNFEKSKLTFSCLGGSDNFKHLNEIDLFNNIDPNESKHKRTDRSILCCLRKGESGQAWPRLTKERAKLNWLSVDFNNWKDWEDDSDEDMSNFDRFSEMMNNMGGDDDVDLPEVDGADDDSPDSDDEKMPDLE
ncbi:PREDICTED: prostaglandin E synthase 3 [Tauraco erythrolophus]|uniref:prostaglandin E synthase 3 n=2 Tax=Neoaves TaxID=3078114 RepID=UPI0005238823|nr:PREDICTED: prostaglandin E synthase 3 [Tauraco erythrolophus]